MAADVLDLCKYPSDGDEALPQRLQTSMSLYSNNLCGLVLLTDDRVSTYSGVAKEFLDICQSSAIDLDVLFLREREWAAAAEYGWHLPDLFDRFQSMLNSRHRD